ncbi:endolytic transglycosylase MltG [Hazenella sp. IB182357]|uniref:Endolytic murein transglycosylase n=1 Tax=Polycladospora coralii TaxID=2771432 RepID=A0A926N7I9_9BACL|nr:endolytic transglycosylase MltG [Polycladospora coralii]MBD1371077.1 endolytic transglycosylase MltG [Polycladospora coralii]MBS7530017.1 endolytic transglycosylase MltG [Polycladospora coralii]
MKWLLRMIFTLVIIVGWVIVTYVYANFTLGSEKRDQPVEVEIIKDMTIAEIGTLLKEKGLIREKYFFRYYAMYKKKTNLKAGVYEVEPGESLDQMLDRFVEGKESKISVTIPEGLNAAQIADKLKEEGLDSEGFLKALNTKEPKYAFEKQIPNDRQRKYKLEGYLFPSTYKFRKDEKPENIVNAMLEQFQVRLDKLNWDQQLKNESLPKNWSIDQVIIVASLIEKEGQVRSELPRIAGVIYNRLEKEPRLLQVDAWYHYYLSMRGEALKKPDKHTKNIESPYNNYKNPGLPPGPICSPSEKAIHAALSPENHQYFFYVTKSDGSQEHYFAKTNEEHLKNIKKSNANEK